MAQKTTTDNLPLAYRLAGEVILPVTDPNRPLDPTKIGDNQVLGVKLMDLIAQAVEAMLPGYVYPTDSLIKGVQVTFAPPEMDADARYISYDTPGNWKDGVAPTGVTVYVPAGTDTSDTSKFPASNTYLALPDPTAFLPYSQVYHTAFLPHTVVRIDIHQNQNYDYWVNLVRQDKTPLLLRGIDISGGKNVIIIGGHIISTELPTSGGSLNKAVIALRNVKRHGFIEGVFLDAANQTGRDGIIVGGPVDPNTTYTIQKCRGIRLYSTTAGLHSDFIQFYGYVGRLQISDCDGMGRYQLYMIDPQQGADRIELHRCYGKYVGKRQGYAFYAHNGAETNPNYPLVILRDVWIDDFDPAFPEPVFTWANGALHPPEGNPKGAVVAPDGESATFPGLQGFDGRVNYGAPPEGTFAPDAGSSYQPQGYQNPPNDYDLSTKVLVAFGDSITAQGGINPGEVGNPVITAITPGNPTVFAKSGHGLTTGDYVYLYACQGLTALNNQTFGPVTVIDPDTFSLPINTTGLPAYTQQGRIFKTNGNIGGLSPEYDIAWLQIKTRHRYKSEFKHRLGLISDTTGGMVQRFPVEVLPLNPDIVRLHMGRNDLGLQRPMAEIQANITTIVNMALSAGIKVVLTTVMPDHAAPPSIRAALTELNTWIRAQASDDVLIADYYEAVADPATGNFKTGFDKDGKHPGASGAEAMGSELRRVLTPLYGYGLLPVAGANNKTPNPTFAGAGGTANFVTVNGLAPDVTVEIGGTNATTPDTDSYAYRTLSKTDGLDKEPDKQVLDFNFPQGSGTTNFTRLRETVPVAQLVVGQKYVAKAVVSIRSLSGTGQLTAWHLRASNQSGVRATFNGRYQGTPSDRIPHDKVLRKDHPIPFTFQTDPFTVESGDTDIRVAIQIGCNTTNGPLAGRAVFHDLYLEPVN